MRRIQQYFLKKGLQQAQPSAKGLKNNDPKITVLTRNRVEVEVVKKYFTRVNFVFYEDLKRPKGYPAKTSHLYKDDFDYRGIPKRTIPEPEGNHLLLNLEANTPILTWYWYARSYDFKVDLCGVYEDADIQIGPGSADTLSNKLDTLQKTLNVITK